MDRKEFLKVCSGACFGLIGISLLQSCETTQHITAIQSGNFLQVNEKDFTRTKDDKVVYRKFIVVKQANSDYPIVVYRKNENSYSALLLKCTHQGNELSVNGDILTCSAHGSEFANDGQVITGPAEQQLKSFPVSFSNGIISIQTA
jgi:Rieske Fe-S protein